MVVWRTRNRSLNGRLEDQNLSPERKVGGLKPDLGMVGWRTRNRALNRLEDKKNSSKW
jgi:hypothetical protein